MYIEKGGLFSVKLKKNNIKKYEIRLKIEKKQRKIRQNREFYRENQGKVP